MSDFGRAVQNFMPRPRLIDVAHHFGLRVRENLHLIRTEWIQGKDIAIVILDFFPETIPCQLKIDERLLNEFKPDLMRVRVTQGATNFLIFHFFLFAIQHLIRDACCGCRDSSYSRVHPRMNLIKLKKVFKLVRSVKNTCA